MSCYKDKVLIVEDSPSLARTYHAQLQSDGYETVPAETAAQAKAAVAEGAFGCILLDLKLPDADGMDLLREWMANDCPAAVVVITAHGSMSIAIDAIKLGAFDFLMKPFDGGRLSTTVRNATENRELKTVVRTYSQKIDRASFCDFVGSSLEMQAVYRTIEGAASSKATVFITGESGTGKELAARAVHQTSPRATNPFVAINCGAIPRDLMESELFGHVKGAFTGATADRDGAAKQVNGGTLFLDEICEMDLALQTKLLRFIQLGTYQPVGGNQTVEADIRFVAATNIDPLDAVRNGRFREDLYYRLHVIPVRLPPLRERGRDVLTVANHFLRQFLAEEGKEVMHFDSDAEDLLLTYEWPGNVRELENVIRYIVVLNNEPVIATQVLRPLLKNLGVSSTASPPAHDRSAVESLASAPTDHLRAKEAIIPLWQVERQTIEEAIHATGGNVQQAARLLDISPSTIYRKKESWERRLSA